MKIIDEKNNLRTILLTHELGSHKDRYRTLMRFFWVAVFTQLFTLNDLNITRADPNE